VLPQARRRVFRGWEVCNTATSGAKRHEANCRPTIRRAVYSLTGHVASSAFTSILFRQAIPGKVRALPGGAGGADGLETRATVLTPSPIRSRRDRSSRRGQARHGVKAGGASLVFVQEVPQPWVITARQEDKVLVRGG
jgi:hypothetical protein